MNYAANFLLQPMKIPFPKISYLIRLPMTSGKWGVNGVNGVN
jgi:hypothetical protein